jgi:hypothetical protein
LNESLEQLYQAARSALKSKDYERASELLKQVLVVDENYKDASRVLARIVREKRRRWYNHPALWGATGIIVVIVLGLILAPRLRQTPQTEMATARPIETISATITPFPTITPTSAPTSVTLAWKRVSIAQFLPRDEITAFGFDPNDSSVLYVETENGGSYKSIDGGSSWGPVQAADPSAMITTANSNQGHQFSNTAPDGIVRLYDFDDLGNEGGYWYLSRDDGKSWSRFSEGGSIPDFDQITFDALGNVYVFCGNNICNYDPDGKPLAILSEPGIGIGSLIALSPSDPKTIFAAGQGLAVSRDAGHTWAKLDNGLGSARFQIEVGPDSSHSLFILSGECEQRVIGSTNQDEQFLYKSADGGMSWDLNIIAGCYLIQDAGGKTLYRHAVDGNEQGIWIWRSTNEGKTWLQIPIPSWENTLIADPSRVGTLYLSDGQHTGQGYVSQDFGNTWNAASEAVRPCYGSSMSFLDSYKPMDIDPNDGNHVLFVHQGTLMESKDSCVTFNPMNLAPTNQVNTVAFDARNSKTIYTGANDGAYVSYDGGQSWSQINDGLLGATVVYSIVVDKDSNVYAATPYGIFKLTTKQ